MVEPQVAPGFYQQVLVRVETPSGVETGEASTVVTVPLPPSLHPFAHPT